MHFGWSFNSDAREAMKILAEKAGIQDLHPVFKLSVRTNGDYFSEGQAAGRVSRKVGLIPSAGM